MDEILILIFFFLIILTISYLQKKDLILKILIENKVVKLY
jgi:hypothetical protein